MILGDELQEEIKMEKYKVTDDKIQAGYRYLQKNKTTQALMYGLMPGKILKAYWKMNI